MSSSDEGASCASRRAASTLRCSGIFQALAPLRAELGVTRAAVEAIMRHLPIVSIEGLRKMCVRRDDVAAYAEGLRYRRHRRPFAAFAQTPLREREDPPGRPVTDLAAHLGHSRRSLTLDTYSHVLLAD